MRTDTDIEPLAFDEYGSGAEPIVWLHGFGGSARSWDRIVPSLPGFRSIVVDLPGHGRSAGRKPCRVPDSAAAVAATMESLGIRHYLCIGHSLGGAVALRVAIKYPEAVRGMLGIGAVPAHGMPAGAATDAILAAFAAAYGNEAVLRAGLPTMAPKADDAYLEQMVQDSLAVSEVAWRNWTSGGTDGARWSQEADLATIKVPCCLLIPGEDLAVAPEDQIRTARAIPQGRAVVLNGSGHFVIGEDPAGVVNEIKAFLVWVSSAGTMWSAG